MRYIDENLAKVTKQIMTDLYIELESFIKKVEVDIRILQDYQDRTKKYKKKIENDNWILNYLAEPEFVERGKALDLTLSKINDNIKLIKLIDTLTTIREDE
jgi:D-alanyl-D-alanine dipeptidase